jgi:hypothetical protein
MLQIMARENSESYSYDNPYAVSIMMGTLLPPRSFHAAGWNSFQGDAHRSTRLYFSDMFS